MGRIVDIYSKNDQYQLIETCMRNRNKRHRLGYFVLEAVKAINLALETNWPIHAAVCPRERVLSSWAAEVLQKAPVVYRLPNSLFEELSDREDPSELLLLAEIRNFSLEEVPLKRGLALLLDRPMNPGNLGSVIRSADAMGADCVIVLGHSADVYDPQCVRASIGTVLTLPVCRIQSPAELSLLRRRLPNIRFVGTSARGETCISKLDLSAPTLLMMGNETDGLSRAMKESCDILVKIPIFGAASSLNLACAASICLYEAQRQRLN